MKKLLSVLLTFVMMFSLASVSAFAADTGTITISTPNKGTVYNIYKMLDIDSATSDYSLVTYKVAEKWENFFKDGTGALDYVSIAQNGAVTAKSTLTQTTAPEFAALAMKYAKDNGIAADKTMTANGTDDVVFTGLDLGYYLVDTSIGVLCGLTTTQPTASIALKNHVPTIRKQVEEDSNTGTGTSAWGEKNTADIGQVVNFDVTIDAQAGAENYVYHDVMDEGLTLKKDTTTPLVVKYHQASSGNTTELDEGTDYTFAVTADNGFTITFAEDTLKDIKGQDKFYILYSAVLNEKADSAGEKNKCWLTFGDHHKTEEDFTMTYCYGYEIVKTDAANTMLDGAKFKMYTTNTPGAEPIKLFKIAENSYRKPTEAEITAGTNIETEIEVKLVDNKAVARITGFDSDIYYIEESQNPNGYNAMVGFREITISDDNVYAEYNADTSYKPGTGIQVINQKGAVLPTTGGMGTMMFVLIGTVVVLGTGVLLVTKKRMSMIDD